MTKKKILKNDFANLRFLELYLRQSTSINLNYILLGKKALSFNKRCFDTVFKRSYRYFSIALKAVFSLSDRYTIFTSNWLWIEIYENVVLSKIDITMTAINKKTLKLIKAKFCVIRPATENPTLEP